MSTNPKVVSKKGSFFNELKLEMKRISWTSKEDLFVLTKIVIGSVFVFALGIYCADVVIRLTLKSIAYLARMITG